MIKVSVAMTTYNGEHYLDEQLMSLVNQKRPSDEVVICDDGSTDNTVIKIKKFIEINNLQNKWKVFSNEKNKGYTINFLDCANMTSGDVIFFCDQDDIWHSEKISKMASEFEKNDYIKAMSCTSKVIDSNGNDKNSIINILRMGSGDLKKMEFSKQVRNNRSAGLTIAIRRDTLDYMRTIIEKYNLPFDLPIGLVTSILEGYYILGDPLVYRRVHFDNVSKPNYTLKSRLVNIDKHIEGRLSNQKLLNVCYNEMYDLLKEEDRLNLKKAINHNQNSITNLRNRKILPLFVDCFSFNPMINRLLSVTNLLCAIFGDYSKSCSKYSV